MMFKRAVLSFACLCVATLSHAQDSELAQQLSNPVADLISLPFQYNVDRNIGSDDEGVRRTLNIQPVIPFSVSENLNVISRTIVPIIEQTDVAPGSGTQSGVGDIVQSFFISPKAPTASGWIWGAGPVFLVPTFSDVSARTWGAGVTGVALKQSNGWTYGGLANHIWSIGEDPETDISNTFLQPFLSYTNQTAWTFTLNSESTYDWQAEQWSVPVNLVVAKLVNIGGTPVSLSAGARYWAEAPETGPEGWGARLVATVLFPR